MTSTSAGTTPEKKAAGPSVRSIERSVPMVVGALAGALGAPLSSSPAWASRLRVVMRVLTTQMGLVMTTVAEPARAPAIMDSTVVRRRVARPALAAADSKKARVHSYQ